LAASLSSVSPSRSPRGASASSNPSWRGASRGLELGRRDPAEPDPAALRGSIATLPSRSIRGAPEHAAVAGRGIERWCAA